MKHGESSLRRRLLVGLLGYVVLLSIAIVIHGWQVNEDAEHLVWETLLNAELDHIQELAKRSPQSRWANTESIAFYEGPTLLQLPAALSALDDGVHDGVIVNGRERVVLVRGRNGGKQVLALDITDFEERELRMAGTLAGSVILVLILLAGITALAVNRMIQPLDRLAAQISGLRPDRPSERITLPRGSTSELAVIGDAVNLYIARNAEYVERERTFIDTASHELRTPLAVIASAAEIAARPPGLPAPTTLQLAHIGRTAVEMRELISLLLVLAKNPARLGKSAERIDLRELMPAVVDDHRHLLEDKRLVIHVERLDDAWIDAPLLIVRAAIGNLLRNAIENSDEGTITVRLELPATVIIDDPGHGMSPEEISRIYSRLARGGGDRAGNGIGLDLISRLCEHLHWTLTFDSKSGHGTVTRLKMLQPGDVPYQA